MAAVMPNCVRRVRIGGPPLAPLAQTRRGSKRPRMKLQWQVMLFVVVVVLLVIITFGFARPLSGTFHSEAGSLGSLINWAQLRTACGG